MIPACHNRPPTKPGYWRHGLDSEGRALGVYVHNRFADKCATWLGTGIGATPETARYPQAHGWAEACKSCRWLPKEFA